MYQWAKALVKNMNIAYTEVSLGLERISGLIKEIRAALFEEMGQSSLPIHWWIIQWYTGICTISTTGTIAI